MHLSPVLNITKYNVTCQEKNMILREVFMRTRITRFFIKIRSGSSTLLPVRHRRLNYSFLRPAIFVSTSRRPVLNESVLCASR